MALFSLALFLYSLEYTHKPKSMGFNYTALKNRNFEIKGQANTQNTSIYNAYTSSICCMHKIMAN